MATLNYDATAHPLLDPQVLALSGSQLQELNAVAEDMLKLPGTGYLADNFSMAVRAVAYQMNYIVAMGTEGTVAASVRRGQRMTVYRGNTGRSSAVRQISPFAKAIMNQLVGWSTGVRSGRSDW